jgi:hypothetical protein
MNLNTVDKRLTSLEKSKAEAANISSVAMEEVLTRMARIADCLKGHNIDEDHMSIMEICAVNVDWSNPYDCWRVLRHITELRREGPSLEGEDRKEFVSRLKTWLAGRGPSTAENTIFPVNRFDDVDVETANNFSRLAAFADEHGSENGE